MQSEPDDLRFFKINIKDIDYFLGLIVTDFHIGKSNDFSVEKNIFINNLKQLVQKVSPTHLFILGDIIDYSELCVTQFYIDFFKLLECNFTLPIYIIPGNHDRHPQFMDYFVNYKNDKYIKCIDTEFLEIPFNNSFSVFLVHDAKYDSNVYGMLSLTDWMNKIRNWNCCKNMIKKNDVMIFGHTHSNFDDDVNKNHSIGPFSVSLKGSNYCLISFTNNEFHFQRFQ